MKLDIDIVQKFKIVLPRLLTFQNDIKISKTNLS